MLFVCGAYYRAIDLPALTSEPLPLLPLTPRRGHCLPRQIYHHYGLYPVGIYVITILDTQRIVAFCLVTNSATRFVFFNPLQARAVSGIVVLIPCMYAHAYHNVLTAGTTRGILSTCLCLSSAWIARRVVISHSDSPRRII